MLLTLVVRNEKWGQGEMNINKKTRD